jgi:hypothetical protein
MANPEVRELSPDSLPEANDPLAFWIKAGDISYGSNSGDRLPFAENPNTGLCFAPLKKGIADYFRRVGSEIDWRYGCEHFRKSVDDIVYCNVLLDLAIIGSHPQWNREQLAGLNIPLEHLDSLEFTGLGFGNSFRSAISAPDNLSANAVVNKRLFHTLSDTMDIDRKLPITGSFSQLLRQKLIPGLLGYMDVDAEFPLEGEPEAIKFRGVMRTNVDTGLPESIVTVRLVEYEHISALEIRISDVSTEDPPNPDFTIHLTNLERDLRVGPQMPTSMNTLIPLYHFNGDEYGYTRVNGRSIETAQWMVLPQAAYEAYRHRFRNPEVIAQPEYATAEEAVHAGLRAIAERLQHLGKYKNDRSVVPFEELLRETWWRDYRKELLSLIYFKKTEESVLGRRNRFLETEIVKLYSRLADFDRLNFLRMAVPMGIIDALEPSLKFLIGGAYGRMFYGPGFTFNNPHMVDTAIWGYCSELTSAVIRFRDDLSKTTEKRFLGSYNLSRCAQAEIDIGNTHMKLPDTLSFIRPQIRSYAIDRT